MNTIKELCEEIENGLKALQLEYKFLRPCEVKEKGELKSFCEKLNGIIFYIEYKQCGLTVYNEDLDATFVFELTPVDDFLNVYDDDKWSLLHILLGKKKFDDCGWSWDA